jgi:hypothetical protein
MDFTVLSQLNEAYRHGVYTEETLSEEELVSIEEWVEALIEEGYDLDQYSDEELYEAYLKDLDEGLTGPRKEYALKRANELRDRSRQAGDIAKRNRGGRHGISDKMHKRAADLVRVATREVGGETYPRKEKGSWETLPRKRGGSGIKGDPKDMDFGVDHSRSAKSDKDLIKSKLRKRALRNINRGMNEELDLYDIVSEYLVSEGFCDSYEDADVIMANMSEEWRESIMEEVLDERNRGEVGMSDREVSRRRNLKLRNPKMSSSSFGDHGSQKPIQKYHARKGKIRTSEHRASRGTRGDLGRVSGTGAISRYSANKEHEDGYPSIVHRGSGPF